MTFRTLLLAGAVFPFALSAPGFAEERGRSSERIVVAQADCEGENCPPAEAPAEEPEAEQPAAEEAQGEQPAAGQGSRRERRERRRQQQQEQQQEAPPEEQPPAEAPPVEEPPAEEPPAEEQPQADEPAAEQPQAEQPAAEEPQAEQPEAGQGNRRERARERARRRQQQLEQEQQQEGQQDAPAAEEPRAEQPPTEEPPAAEAPPVAEEPPTAEEPPAAEEGASDEPTAAPRNRRERARERARRRQQQLQEQGGAPEQPAQGQPEPEQPAPEQDQPAEEAPSPDGDAAGGEEAQSTVEQQLEAQGDDEDAKRVRDLRRKLRREREQVEAGNDEPVESNQPSDGQPVVEDSIDGGPETRERRRERRERRDREREERGGGRVVEERGDRIIIDLGGGNLRVEPIVPDEGERLLYNARDVEVEQLRGGRTRTIVFRENGSQIITVRNRYGDIVSRTRVTPNGREIVLIDNRYLEADEVEGAPPPVIFEPADLPPLVVEIPRDRYIVDLGGASRQQIQETLLAPPVQRVERSYTLDEVTRNEELRAYVPRIDLDTITFEFGSSTIANTEMDALEGLGVAMEEVLAANPEEVYLVEGHTDAVGSDYDNLILSDRRAEAVAVALSQNFDIPPENLVTEGYGEQDLKVDTDGPERANRRVTVRRITPLLSAEAQQ